MNNLSKVFVFKIAFTAILWVAPLLILPSSLLNIIGFPEQSTSIFIRLLGWAYLCLALGYCFGLRESLKERRAIYIIWVGIVSNGGACLFLAWYGFLGTWSTWGDTVRLAMWISMAATGLITFGLIQFGLREKKFPTI